MTIKQHTIPTVALFLLLLSACSREQMPLPESQSFKAFIEQENPTKTSASFSSGSMLLQWVDSDRLSINGITYKYSGTASGAAAFNPETAGQAAVPDADGKFRAYYPASLCSGGSPALPGSVSVNSPSSTGLLPEWESDWQNFVDYGYYNDLSYDNFLDYLYSKYYVKYSIADILGYSDYTCSFPMYAESSDNALYFRNICSLIGVTLDAAQGTYWVKIESLQNPLWGPFTVQDGKAVIDESACTPEEIQAHKTLWVKIEHSPMTKRIGQANLYLPQPLYYYIPVPDGDYPQGSLKITFTNQNKEPLNAPQTNATGVTTLRRSHIHGVNTLVPYLMLRYYNIKLNSETLCASGVINTPVTQTITLPDYKYTTCIIYPHTNCVVNSYSRNEIVGYVVSGLENLDGYSHTNPVLSISQKNNHEDGSESPYDIWDESEVHFEQNPTASPRTTVIRYSLKYHPECYVELTIIQPGNPNV